MKQKFKYIAFVLVSFVFFGNTVLAADYSYSITSQDVTVGNSITLKIDGTSSGLTGRFNISSSNTSVATLSSSFVWIENNSQSVTINAKKAGSAVITITPTEGISDRNADAALLSPKTITINVKDKPVVSNNTTTNNNTGSNTNRDVIQAKAKSANNYLSSLTVDELKLDSEFDKEKLEYAVEVPAETEKIKINAQLADSKASVSGTGEVDVKTGINTFEIVVTAENGSKRTYILKANVLELEPTIISVGSDEYTLVKKREELPKISDYFIEKDIIIGEETVEGYYNEKLDYSVVGLKDDNGKINYYIYKNNKYTLYKEYTFAGTTLQILDKKVDNGYKKVSFNYDGDKITSYQEVKMDIIKNTYALDNNDITGNQFYLFYAINVETGKEYLYQYDALEKTVQRYNTQVLDMYKDNSNTYYMYLLIALLVIGVLVITLSITLISKNKKKKNVSKKNKKDRYVEDEEEDE